MTTGKKRPQPPIPVAMHGDARTELAELDEATAADVAVVIAKVNNKTHQEIANLLDVRSDPKVCQYEKSHKRGTLRVVFVWGRDVLWYVGALVKVDNPDGERRIKRILSRADSVRGTGVN